MVGLDFYLFHSILGCLELGQLIYLSIGRSFPTILDFSVAWFGTSLCLMGLGTQGEYNFGEGWFLLVFLWVKGEEDHG